MIKARVNTILSIWIWLCHTAVPLTPWNTQWIPPSAGRQPPTPGSMGTSAIFLIISGYVWEDNIFLSSAITEMLSHRYPNAYFSHYHYHLDTHHNNNRYCIPLPSCVLCHREISGLHFGCRSVQKMNFTLLQRIRSIRRHAIYRRVILFCLFFHDFSLYYITIHPAGIGPAYKKDPHGLPRQVFLAIIYSVLSVLYYSQSLENASATN